MKSPFAALAVLAALALTGCGTIEQISYGSWLDRVGERKPARYPLAPEERSALVAKAGELHARGDALRVKLAAEKDRVQRIAYMSQLEDIGDELRPVEKVLRDGGTNSRRYPAPPDYVQGGGL
jgi:hypothetical protein